MEGGLPLSDMGVILKSGGGVGQKKLALSFLLVSVLFTGCSGDIPPVPVLIKASVRLKRKAALAVIPSVSVSSLLTAFLKKGDVVSLELLLNALLVFSANDSAVAIIEFIALREGASYEDTMQLSSTTSFSMASRRFICR